MSVEAVKESELCSACIVMVTHRCRLPKGHSSEFHDSPAGIWLDATERPDSLPMLPGEMKDALRRLEASLAELQTDPSTTEEDLDGVLPEDRRAAAIHIAGEEGVGPRELEWIETGVVPPNMWTKPAVDLAEKFAKIRASAFRQARARALDESDAYRRGRQSAAADIRALRDEAFRLLSGVKKMVEAMCEEAASGKG